MIFLAKNKVFGAGGVSKKDPKKNEHIEKCAPRRAPFWAPKLTPKGVQEELKMGTLFGALFGAILGHFWGSFGGHLGPKTGPGEVWRSLREPSGAPRGQKDDFQKSGFR